jgi:hypothetical protein
MGKDTLQLVGKAAGANADTLQGIGDSRVVFHEKVLLFLLHSLDRREETDRKNAAERDAKQSAHEGTSGMGLLF